MENIDICGRSCFYVIDKAAEFAIIQPLGTHEIATIETEIEMIQKCGIPFSFIGVPIKNWNDELSPWEAPAAFGSESFGNGASSTLLYIQDAIVPYIKGEISAETKILLGGYSLAGLFSLWSAYKTDVFDGVAAVSPSVWLNGWIEYAAGNAPKTDNIYLSLGSKEHKTKNPILKTVKSCIEQQYEILRNANINTILERNEGNHFTDPSRRVVKGFAWLMAAYLPVITFWEVK